MSNIVSTTSGPLAHAAEPAFSIILSILAGVDPGDPAQLRTNIGNAFAQMERQTREIGVPAEEILAARFALTAFLDEAIARSDWQGRAAWAQNPLSLEYFSTSNAGVEFFDKLEELRLRPHAHADLLEVYYTCLVLGFEGKYALADPARLQALVDATRRDLERLGPPARDLSPHWEPPAQVFADVKTGLPLGVIGAIMLGGVFIIYLVFRVLAHGQAEAVAERIRALL